MTYIHTAHITASIRTSFTAGICEPESMRWEIFTMCISITSESRAAARDLMPLCTALTASYMTLEPPVPPRSDSNGAHSRSAGPVTSSPPEKRPLIAANAASARLLQPSAMTSPHATLGSRSATASTVTATATPPPRPRPPSGRLSTRTVLPLTLTSSALPISPPSQS